MDERDLLTLRGQNISMIFQNPLTSLNPLFTVERHFLETIHFHDPAMPRDKALAAVEKMLETLGIEKKRLKEYPHQLSGGMRQRIMIGLALIMNPDILIADEPTTSLDVIVEAGFTELLGSLRRLYKLSIILITHNLGLVAEIADRIAVMYAGTDHGDRPDAGHLRPAAAPVHAGAHRLRAEHPRGPERARDHAREPARPRRPARRVPVRAALPAGHADLPREEPLSCGACPRAFGRLLAARGGTTEGSGT